MNASKRARSALLFATAALSVVASTGIVLGAAPTFPEAPTPTPATFANTGGGVRAILVLDDRAKAKLVVSHWDPRSSGMRRPRFRRTQPP